MSCESAYYDVNKIMTVSDSQYHHDAIYVKIKMVPYSLSACQVVRVFCAVMRALGASPIMSLGIVFYRVSDCKVALQCYVILSSLSLLLNWLNKCARPPPPLRFCAPSTSLLKDFLEFLRARHTKNNHVVMACSCA